MKYFLDSSHISMVKDTRGVPKATRVLLGRLLRKIDYDHAEHVRRAVLESSMASEQTSTHG